jgi:hypothetical protein
MHTYTLVKPQSTKFDSFVVINENWFSSSGGSQIENDSEYESILIAIERRKVPLIAANSNQILRLRILPFPLPTTWSMALSPMKIEQKEKAEYHHQRVGGEMS